MTEFNQQVVSIIRTFVPVLVGQLITWLAAYGIMDSNGAVSASLITLFTIGFTTLYYAVARFLEVKVSAKFGWLLGAPKAPSYSKDN